MSVLVWRKSDGSVLNVAETPFRTENEFETYIYQTPELLGDLFLLKRQVQTGQKQGIPDIIALDQEGNVVIVELKNQTVSEEVIPQVLQYAIWAETNPDSLHNLWLQLEEKPEEILPSWESISVRILIAAPSIPTAVLRLVNKINYPVQLLEVKRFSGDSNEFVLVNELQPERHPRVTVTRGMGIYDEEFYIKNGYNKASIPAFFEVVNQIDDLITRKGWNLEKKLNKGYVNYKFGFPGVFGVLWLGSKSFGSFFKLPKNQIEELEQQTGQKIAYQEQWKQAVVRYEPQGFSVNRLLPLFETAHEYVVHSN
jgi:hypothetical protein